MPKPTYQATRTQCVQKLMEYAVRAQYDIRAINGRGTNACVLPVYIRIPTCIREYPDKMSALIGKWTVIFTF